ncbi:hypothetical protein [Arthrobacter sp. NicSoilB8]|uniref:hypothetical protein n=1 Tax=Arthrobacter sp. NicSoilB8 TaxID=2830998 RepID=UPI001CC3B6D3|nr:hypothetical protein [Arthrobacter sp. NicSoilB8]BCW69191.1 hypothetical protein NicSoilB8_02350 [Arthrobacter sp. NicSoilB8]
MTQNNQRSPIEEAGGYGTPTVEKELPFGDERTVAQPREEEAFDAAGLNQDNPDGETYPAGAPDLSQFGTEDQESAGEPGAGRFGGTEEQMSSENASTGTGFEAESRDAEVPSTDAEMDASNTEEPDAGRPFSSESGQDAAGLPDGSGTDLPNTKSPDGRDKEPFDAG